MATINVKISSIPNAETIEAIQETEKMKMHPDDYRGYDDIDEMIEDLLKRIEEW
ncbi:hypothetical protein [Acidaminobacter hydrogenoformans]|uniref:Uncharacterized protein n=1 Tax=Acidaminobacter hydrogenoformans DSM 2784 TaxID=1120920 RepID=A0A1G5S7N2_9FIRM|nr:hypothetical protein [Acidaminobacter hydrogenoformans]SCZ81609.1 hypothetical protein SAMN03080599_02880 [Acidaminobacter hydrogenoformans DSM 2784]